jgi:hypothetical protein
VQTVTEVKIPLGVGVPGKLEYAPTVTGAVFWAMEGFGKLATTGVMGEVAAPQLERTNNIIASIATRREVP